MKKTKIIFTVISFTFYSFNAVYADALEDKMNSALAGKIKSSGNLSEASGSDITNSLKSGVNVKLLQEKAASVQADPFAYFNSLSGAEKKKVDEITKKIPQ